MQDACRFFCTCRPFSADMFRRKFLRSLAFGMANLAETIGQRISEARHRARVSVRQLLERTGYSRSAFSCWERGVTAPPADALAVLCRELRVSADWVLYGAASADDFAALIDTTVERTTELAASGEELSLVAPRLSVIISPALELVRDLKAYSERTAVVRTRLRELGVLDADRSGDG